MIRLCHLMNKLPSSQNEYSRLSGRDSSSLGIKENLSESVKKIRPIGQKKKRVQVTGKTSYAQVREKQKVILRHEPTRKELFCACFSKDGITQNEEAANAIVSTKTICSFILSYCHLSSFHLSRYLC